MEARAKQDPEILVSLGMEVKPRHGATVVLGCATVKEHALDHAVHYFEIYQSYRAVYC